MLSPALYDAPAPFALHPTNPTVAPSGPSRANSEYYDVQPHYPPAVLINEPDSDPVEAPRLQERHTSLSDHVTRSLVDSVSNPPILPLDIDVARRDAGEASAAIVVPRRDEPEWGPLQIVESDPFTRQLLLDLTDRSGEQSPEETSFLEDIREQILSMSGTCVSYPRFYVCIVCIP